MIWQAEEWEINGNWYCNCVKALGTPHMAEWQIPARILSMSPAQYLQFVIDNYKPDHIYANKEKCLVFFSWSKQADERKFKNFINAKAREKNFQI